MYGKGIVRRKFNNFFRKIPWPSAVRVRVSPPVLIERSSSGRMADSDSVDVGSNPALSVIGVCANGKRPAFGSGAFRYIGSSPITPTNF